MIYYFKSTRTQMGPGHHILHYHSSGQTSVRGRIIVSPILCTHFTAPLFLDSAVHVSVVLMLLCNHSLRY